MRAALILAAMITCGPARADWQYAHWGMTPEETLAASHGQLRWCDAQCKRQVSDDDIALLYGDYQSGEFKFTLFMFFGKETKSLSYVRLRLTEPKKSDQLVEVFRKQYSEPKKQENTEVMKTFTWNADFNWITIRQIGYGAPPDLTTVTYLLQLR